MRAACLRNWAILLYDAGVSSLISTSVFIDFIDAPSSDAYGYSFGLGVAGWVIGLLATVSGCIFDLK